MRLSPSAKNSDPPPPGIMALNDSALNAALLFACDVACALTRSAMDWYSDLLPEFVLFNTLSDTDFNSGDVSCSDFVINGLSPRDASGEF
jgi:hypothetical protein